MHFVFTLLRNTAWLIITKKKKRNTQTFCEFSYALENVIFYVIVNSKKKQQKNINVLYLFTVVDVSAARSDELPLCDNVNECLLFKYDVCVMPFCRWCTRYVWRQLNKPVSLSANAGHFGGTSNIFTFYILQITKIHNIQNKRVRDLSKGLHIHARSEKQIYWMCNHHRANICCWKSIFRFTLTSFTCEFFVRVILYMVNYTLKDETCKHEHHLNLIIIVFFLLFSCFIFLSLLDFSIKGFLHKFLSFYFFLFRSVLRN